MNVTEYLLQNAKDSDIAIIEGSGSHSYAQLKAAVSRLSGELAAHGARAGGRIGVLGANSFFWVASYLAVMKSGGVAVPFSTMLTAEEVRRNADFAGVKAVFMDRRQQRAFGSAFAEGT